MSDSTQPPRDATLRDLPLPVELTSFVGRERELAEVERLLAGTRLLTLTGPGGSGKTRLALAAAEGLWSGFDDGVRWVGLAALSDPALAPQAVASAVGAREQPGQPLIDTLSRHLRPRKMLLVLDNCEHLVEACARLADALLRACPNLRVLATSREALGIAGETVRTAPPLSLPDTAGRLPPVEELARYEAIRLFAERAAAVLPAFALTEQNAAAVARVCRRLDGMPLAIELAAARMRALSAEQISARLDDSFRLLTTGSRTALPRQQTLRATMDWSHDLLTQSEQTMFRRLGVFAGGFTLEAAEVVCAGEGIERDGVLDLLSHLVDRSLVVVVRERSEDARYGLLETVRQYGGEKLRSSGEEPAVRRLHAGVFLRLAEEAEPGLNGAERGAWLARLDDEHDNLRAALRRAAQTGETETGLRLGGALFWFWFHRGYWSEGRRWLEGALVGAPARTASRAKALYGAGFLAWTQGDHAAARSQLEESVGIWRELGDERGLAHALHILGMELLGHGERVAARSLAEESVEIFREGGDAFGLAISLASSGISALNQGDHAAARAILEESVAVCRRIGDRWAVSLPLRNLGIAAFREGEYERAGAFLKESLVVLRELGEKWFVTRSLEHLAVVASMRGDHRRAARLFGAGEALREVFGASVLPFYRADYDRGVQISRGALGEESFAAAWAEGRAMTLERAVAHALEEEAPSTGYPAGLTTREVEVLALVAAGLTSAEIAERLFVSPSTVNAHLRTIYGKLGVGSRAAATRFAVEHGLA